MAKNKYNTLGMLDMLSEVDDAINNKPPKKFSKNIAVLGVRDGSSKKYKQNIFIESLKDYERDIEKWLGNPMQKARDVKKSEPAVTPGTRFLVNPLRLTPEQIEQRELQDNERHSAAGYYTAKAITDKFPEWSQYTGIPQAIGTLGSIGLGIGHEIISNKYTRPHENDPYTKWNVLREALEDGTNNTAGAIMSAIPFMSESEKIDALKYMSDNNMLPDGVDFPNGENLYWKNEKGEINKPYKKKQYGGLAKFVDGGEDPPYKKISSETTQSQVPAYMKYLPKSFKEAEQKQELIDKAKAIQAKLEKQYYEEELASLRNSPVALGRSIALGVNPVEAKEKIEKQNKEYAKTSAQEKLQEELRPLDDDYILEKAVEYGSLLAGPEVFELGALTKMGVKNLAKFFAKKSPVNTFTTKMGPFGRSIQSKVINPTEFPKELPKELESYLFSDVVNSERVFYDREGNIIPEPKERWYSSPHEHLGDVELINHSEFDPWNPSMTIYGTPVRKPSKVDLSLTSEEIFSDDVVEKTVLPTDVQQKGFFNLKGAIQKYPKGPLTQEEITAYKNSDFYKQATTQHEEALSKYGDKWTLPNYAEKDLQEAIETGNRSRINPTLYGGRNWTASDYIIAGMVGSAYPGAVGVNALAFSPPAVKSKALQKMNVIDPREFGTLSDKDTTIDITNRPMDFAKVNQIKDGQIIIGGEFIEDANNTVRKAKDWLTATDTYSDKEYSSKDIQSFYGIENGKFKVGKASDFKSETEIVPRRFGAINIDKAILNDKEMRLLDKEGNPIYQNTPNTGKFILYSPSTGKAQFTYVNTGKSGVEKVNAFLKKNKDAQYIHLDNGRYEYYGLNPEGLTETDFRRYYQQDLERKGNPGYNLILKKEGGNFSNLQKFIR